MVKDKKILIIDDEYDVVRYLSMVLKDNGFEVESSESADDALQKVADYAPDLITLDIMMPRKSGIWFYKKLREKIGNKAIPVIIVSGIGAEKEFDIHELLPDENIVAPEAFVEKPIDVEGFVETVKRILRDSKL